MNEAKVMKKLVKKDFNKLGLAILMNGIIANVVIVIGFISIGIICIIKNPNISSDSVMQIAKSGNYSGIMSIIAVIIALLPFVIYRGKDLFLSDLKTENKKFTIKTIVLGAIILLSINSLLEGFANVLEIGLNTVGFSANNAMKELEILNDFTIPMMIYSCIVGPIIEELIYRGAVLKSLEKYGKRFAIIISAILFGLMHGNFYQVFMAAGIGIVLGYLATEYSIKLTIILHMINNICAQILSQISTDAGSNIENIINISIMVVAIIILIIVFIKKRNNIKMWLQNNRIEKGLMLNFFTSILIILIVAIDILCVISGIGRV